MQTTSDEKVAQAELETKRLNEETAKLDALAKVKEGLVAAKTTNTKAKARMKTINSKIGWTARIKEKIISWAK